MPGDRERRDNARLRGLDLRGERARSAERQVEELLLDDVRGRRAVGERDVLAAEQMEDVALHAERGRRKERDQDERERDRYRTPRMPPPDE